MNSDDNSSDNTQDDYGHDDPRDTSFLNSFQRDPSAMKNRVSAGFMNEPDQQNVNNRPNRQLDDTFVPPPLPPTLPVTIGTSTAQPAHRNDYQSYSVVDTTAAPKSQGYDVAPSQRTSSIPQPVFHGSDEDSALKSPQNSQNQQFNNVPSSLTDIDSNQLNNRNQIDPLPAAVPVLGPAVFAPVIEQQQARISQIPVQTYTLVGDTEPKPASVETLPPNFPPTPQKMQSERLPPQPQSEAAPTPKKILKPIVSQPLLSPWQPLYGPVTAAQAAGVTKSSRVKRPPRVKEEMAPKERQYVPNTILNKTDSQILLLVFAVFLAFFSGIGYFLPLLGVGIGLTGLFLIILLRNQSPTLGKIGFAIAIIGISFSGFMYYRTAFRFNYEAYISSQYNYVIYKPNNWNITTSTTESSSITRFDSPEIDDKNPLASVGVATLLNTPKNNDSDSAKNSLFQRYARAVATPYDDYEEVKREEITIDDLPALYINAQGSIDGRTDMLEYYVIYNQRGNSYVLSFNRYSAKKDDFEKNFIQIRDSFDANADLENIGK